MTNAFAQNEFRIGVDIGGTFTDLVMALPTGEIDVFKVPSDPSDPAAGVFRAIRAAATAHGQSAEQLLSRCSLFVHGSTIATNTLLEHKGAKVGALVTKGFRDSLEIRRGLRADPWDHRSPYPPVLAPRFLRRPVEGRLDRHGDEVALLAESDVDAAADFFEAQGVEAVAICLINSFVNDRHEQRCAEVLRRRGHPFWLSISSEVAPIMGEYERSSTAVLNAYVGPRAVSYLKKLDALLVESGLPGRLLLIQNNGGAVSVDEIAARPVALLLSGPAAGVGALNYYARAIGSDDLISMEIGGTSCDVILMSGGTVAQTDQLQIEGYDAVTPSIDVHTIGAGGGTIAGVDGAGMLFVGPQGAGAKPGPACYGLGGTAPTITDAQLVLGRLDPTTYAGGVISIDADLAHKAMAKVGSAIGLDTPSTAAGVIRLMEQKLLHAVQRISIERGHDPRRFTLVAGGGGGALHGSTVARALGCRRVYVPRIAGAFCALGMLHSDVRHDLLKMYFGRLDQLDESAVAGIFGDLESAVRATLAREGFADRDVAIERSLDLRYRMQQWDITVGIPLGPLDPIAIRRRFEAEHERLFGHSQPEGSIEITKARIAGIGKLPALPVSSPAPADKATPTAGRRSVWIDPEHGWLDTAIYSGASLEPGHSFQGPAIVEERTTTVMVGPHDRLTVDGAGNFVIDLLTGERKHGQ